MVCNPPAQDFGPPNGLFCVGFWQCYPDCNDWFWIGQKRTLYGGWIGDPFSGYTLVPKPTQPCGTVVPPTPPTPPPPAPNPHAPPTETHPPAPDTGHDTAPPPSEIAPKCGSSMATLNPSDMRYHYGFNQEEHTDWPGVAKLLSANKYASMTTVQGKDLIEQTRPTFTQRAYKEYDADRNISVLHPAAGPGEIWVTPAELEDYNLGGDLSDYTGKLPDGKLPRSISRVGLNIASFRRNNPDTGTQEAAADGYIGLGAYHPTGAYVADGWVQYLDGAAGARQFNIRPTSYDAALASGRTMKVWGTLTSTMFTVPDDGTIGFSFNGANVPASVFAGIGFDTESSQGPKLVDTAGVTQLRVTETGVVIPGKLSVIGFIDPTGIGFSLQAVRPGAATTQGNGIWVDNTASRRLWYYNGSSDVQISPTAAGGWLNDPGGNGVVVRTSAGATTARSVAVNGAGNKAGLTVANGDGVSGNPTIGLDITGLADDALDRIAVGDEIPFYNVSAGANHNTTLQLLLDKGLAGLTQTAFDDISGDFVAYVDAAAAKRASLQQLWDTSNLLTAGTPILTSKLAGYLASASAARSFTANDILKLIDSMTAGTPLLTSKLAGYLASASDVRSFTSQDIFNLVNSLTAETSIDKADKLPLYDVADGVNGPSCGSVTVEELLKGLRTLTQKTSIGRLDRILIADESASGQAKYVTLEDLDSQGNLMVSGSVAYTGNGVSGLTVTLTGINRCYALFIMRYDTTGTNTPVVSMPRGATGAITWRETAGTANTTLSLGTEAAGNSQVLTINSTASGLNANTVLYRIWFIGTAI